MMNLELMDAFGQHFPEEQSGQLEAGIITCCAFNRWGSMLACGCNDGRVTVFDFVTRQSVKTIQAHASRILSLSWSRSGRYMATTSIEQDVSVWNVLTNECKFTFHFPSQPRLVHLSPASVDQLLVTLWKHPPHVLDCTTNECQQVANPQLEEGEEEQVACFDHRGEHLLSGSNKGRVTVYKAKDVTTPIASFKLHNANVTKAIVYFMTISADRIVRVYDFRAVLLVQDGTAEPTQKLQDMVNKTPWSTVCMSGSGDFICAATEKNVAMYIWERNTGNLVKILTGAKGDNLTDMCWHPFRPVVASVSRGVVTIWSQTHVENWSAFAPAFKELEENVEYEERESDFDCEDEDKSEKGDGETLAEDVSVDVTNVEAASDDEIERRVDDQPLYFIPITPDMHHSDVVETSPVKPINVTLRSPTDRPPKAAPLRQASPSANTRKRSHKRRKD